MNFPDKHRKHRASLQTLGSALMLILVTLVTLLLPPANRCEALATAAADVSDASTEIASGIAHGDAISKLIASPTAELQTRHDLDSVMTADMPHFLVWTTLSCAHLTAFEFSLPPPRSLLA